MKSSWAICTTVKSSPQVINYFIDYHLNQGVSEIFVFLDQPQEFDFQELLYFKHPRVTIFSCDDEFWQNRSYFDILPHKQSEKPVAIEHRQYHNLLHAYEICESEWIAMIDIDELIYSKENISHKLAAYPTNVFSVCMEPLEAIYQDEAPKHLLESYKTKFFKSRKLINYKYWNKIYGEHLKHYSGFFGHILGKTFLRTNCLLKSCSCHITRPLDTTYAVAVIDFNIHLLHYEAAIPDEFVQKSLNRIYNKASTAYLDQNSRDRLNYIQREYELNGVNGLYDLYNLMHVRPKELIQKLKYDGYVLDIDELPNFGYYIKTFHGTFLAYQISTNKVVAINKNELKDNTSYIPIQCAYSQTTKNLIQRIYFHIDDNAMIDKKYLYVDKFNCLKSFNKIKTAQLFEIIKISPGKFAVMFEGSFLTVTRDGHVTFTANEQNSWEVFMLVNREELV